MLQRMAIGAHGRQHQPAVRLQRRRREAQRPAAVCDRGLDDPLVCAKGHGRLAQAHAVLLHYALPLVGPRTCCSRHPRVQLQVGGNELDRRAVGLQGRQHHRQVRTELRARKLQRPAVLGDGGQDSLAVLADALGRMPQLHPVHLYPLQPLGVVRSPRHAHQGQLDAPAVGETHVQALGAAQLVRAHEQALQGGGGVRLKLDGGLHV
mmetsp:Transcript_33581/g.104280  ORF Transcript_33581/g.104280 Transcript_33581/m.104280 type:complete len:207 (-) Transcript_33581:42-662(-)